MTDGCCCPKIRLTIGEEAGLIAGPAGEIRDRGGVLKGRRLRVKERMYNIIFGWFLEREREREREMI